MWKTFSYYFGIFHIKDYNLVNKVKGGATPRTRGHNRATHIYGISWSEDTSSVDILYGFDT